MKNVKILVASLIISFVPLMAFATPAHAATRLGGVSMYSACVNQQPGSELALIANNAVSWKCRFWSSLGPVYFGIDVNKQCKKEYNNTNAYGAYSDYNNPYSWSCYK
jgi:hypothetical protein